ncbi:MAG: GTP-binding protein, partial [Methyloprofundus sp.]|nr:GTP-binding protein [Methyloprofundus sp.]
MAYDYSDLVKQAQNWAKQLVSENWLAEAELQRLLNDDLKPAQSLFEINAEPPLVVAFLGGTGVGKSTLLNRLAAKNIAKTGVVRPTSKEVTLFHHADIHINQLPAGFPLEKIRVDKHFEEQNRHIIWMDMPDFDSTEQSNQRIVLDWLPHIDVLIYVVSPERYRDNKAWQLLLAEGGKHAWVFVLNQSDRAQPEQYDDFIQQLHKAGFSQPLVY